MRLLPYYLVLTALFFSIFDTVTAQNDLTLNLVFDRYRSETSWEITDESSTIVAEGADYGADFGANGAYPNDPIAISNLPNGNYTFTIMDEYGDGMCCSNGQGSYELINDADGETIASGGSYGDSESTAFTLPFVAPPSGCTDPDAANYDPNAEVDDGSCTYLTTPISITLTPFATGLNKPVGMKHAGDERLFVCEQTSGKVRILDANGDVIGDLIDVQSDITSGGEKGLLGIAFHPNFAENGYFYLNYTNNSSNTEIIRYTVPEATPNQADVTSGEVIIQISQPYGNHNAGDLQFGPDGYLYLPMGDGGSGGDPQNYAQSPTSLLGKILRLDVDGDDFPGDNNKNYAIPADNPFVESGEYLPEVWATGMRNPWRFSFDSQTGDLWIGDVGQSAYEEVNMQLAESTGGENYGWRCYEGFHNYNTSGCESFENYQAPVVEFAQGEYGWCSVIGGYVYRGAEYPLLEGLYFTTDYCGGDIYSIRQNANGDWMKELVNDQYAAGFTGFVGFGEDINGELYVLRDNGTIYRIEEPCSASIPVITENGSQLSSSSGVSYQWLLNGQIIEGATEQDYTALQNGDYSVVVDNGSGCVVESDTVTVVISSLIPNTLLNQLVVSPNPTTGTVYLAGQFASDGKMHVEVIDGTGRMVKRIGFGHVTGSLNRAINLSELNEGLYFLNVYLNNNRTTKRIALVR